MVGINVITGVIMFILSIIIIITIIIIIITIIIIIIIIITIITIIIISLVLNMGQLHLLGGWIDLLVIHLDELKRKFWNMSSFFFHLEVELKHKIWNTPSIFSHFRDEFKHKFWNIHSFCFFLVLCASDILNPPQLPILSSPPRIHISVVLPLYHHLSLFSSKFSFDYGPD